MKCQSQFSGENVFPYLQICESHRQEIYLRPCAPSEDSDQPAHFWIAKDVKCLHADHED